MRIIGGTCQTCYEQFKKQSVSLISRKPHISDKDNSLCCKSKDLWDQSGKEEYPPCYTFMKVKTANKML